MELRFSCEEGCLTKKKCLNIFFLFSHIAQATYRNVGSYYVVVETNCKYNTSVNLRVSEDEHLRILNGCLKQDRRAQKDLYRVHYDYSLRICSRYASNRDDAISILNEGFFKVFFSLKKYDFKRPFTTWLGKIMTNTAIDFYRANLRYTQETDIDAEAFDVASTESVLSKLRYEDLLGMIRNLTPAYRAVFNLYVIDGYSHQEISEILNISVGASKSNLYKARIRLSEMLFRLDNYNDNQKQKNMKEATDGK